MRSNNLILLDHIACFQNDNVSVCEKQSERVRQACCGVLSQLRTASDCFVLLW